MTLISTSEAKLSVKQDKTTPKGEEERKRELTEKASFFSCRLGFGVVN